jgi:methylated-DNA-[protein]-cysteine S-methyltransferase
MATTTFAIFETAFGACGLAWGEHGIIGGWLHGRTAERTRAQIVRQHPEACEAIPPAEIANVIEGITGLLGGEPRDLRGAVLDMGDVPEFARHVYEITRTIPPGETMTYGAIARAMGEAPLRAREVGEALGRNPFAPIVPCHRVVAAGGRLGGYSAPGGRETKRRLLEIEGASLAAQHDQQSLFDLRAT